MFFSQLLLFIEMLRSITLKSIPWMKMSKDCWECLDSHSCAETKGNFGHPSCTSTWVVLSVREVKTEFLLQGQWKSQIQASGSSSDLVSVSQEQDWERPFIPVCNGPTLSQCASLLRQRQPGVGSSSVLCTFVLKMCMYSSGLLVFILIRRQTHAGSWSNRWEML